MSQLYRMDSSQPNSSSHAPNVIGRGMRGLGRRSAAAAAGTNGRLCNGFSRSPPGQKFSAEPPESRPPGSSVGDSEGSGKLFWVEVVISKGDGHIEARKY